MTSLNSPRDHHQVPATPEWCIDTPIHLLSIDDYVFKLPKAIGGPGDRPAPMNRESSIFTLPPASCAAGDASCVTPMATSSTISNSASPRYVDDGGSFYSAVGVGGPSRSPSTSTFNMRSSSGIPTPRLTPDERDPSMNKEGHGYDSHSFYGPNSPEGSASSTPPLSNSCFGDNSGHEWFHPHEQRFMHTQSWVGAEYTNHNLGPDNHWLDRNLSCGSTGNMMMYDNSMMYGPSMNGYFEGPHQHVQHMQYNVPQMPVTEEKEVSAPSICSTMASFPLQNNNNNNEENAINGSVSFPGIAAMASPGFAPMAPAANNNSPGFTSVSPRGELDNEG